MARIFADAGGGGFRRVHLNGKEVNMSKMSCFPKAVNEWARGMARYGEKPIGTGGKLKSRGSAAFEWKKRQRFI
jgi:hypothetical protein